MNVVLSGKNDGSVKGVRYFKCRSRHGVFVRHDKLIMDKKRAGVAARGRQSSLRRSTGNLTSKASSGGGAAGATSSSSPRNDVSGGGGAVPSYMRSTYSSSTK